MLKAQKGEPAVTYCGLDMGKKSSHFCLVDEKRKVLEEGKVRNTEVALRRAFGKRTAMRICIEASGLSPWVARILTALGHEVIVANAQRVRLIAESTSSVPCITISQLWFRLTVRDLCGR